MDFKYLTERLDADKPEHIARAAYLLRAGGTVAFPTETVYGLGANALNPNAVAKIFTAKQRPSWDPLIVHIGDLAMLAQVATVTPDNLGRNIATRLMDAFWPGPLTLLLPRSPAIPDAVTASRPLVGVRMPSHPVALDLIRRAGIPIAAPSANTFAHTSPTTAAHVLADLDCRIDAVLDGGPTQFGLESTVAGFDLNQNIVIYRPGAVTLRMIESIVGTGAVHLYQPEILPVKAPREGLPSPGVGLRHYAPRAKLILVDKTDHDPQETAADHLEAAFEAATEAAFEAAIEAAIEAATDSVARVAVMLPDHWNPAAATLIYRWGPWRNLDALAQRLFSGLRDLDDAGATLILCPVPAPGGLADAIRDRLQKAAK